MIRPLEYHGTDKPFYAMDVILQKQKLWEEEKANEKPSSEERPQ